MDAPLLFSPDPVGEAPGPDWIWRRTFTDAGIGLRSDWAPSSVPNDRAKLMAFWKGRDAELAAEAEAAAAAEVDRLAALEQTPPEAEGAMALAALASRVDALEPRVIAVEGLAMATPEEVVRGAAQISRVAGLASEIEAISTDATKRIDGVAQGAEERLASLDGQLAAVVATAGDVVTDCRATVERMGAEMQAQTAKAIARRITALEIQAQALRGPKGNTGGPGVSTVVGAGKPVDANTLMPLIERGAIRGDVYIDANDDARRAYRWDGRQWEPGPAFVSTVTRDVKISSVDASTKVTSLQTISGSGGGGGGGGEHLLVNRIGLRGSTAIGDTSNWAGISDIRSGIASIDLLAMDGGNQGKTYAVELPFTWDTSGDQFTADGELGNLLGLYTVSISVQRSAAVAPAVFTGSMPPGAQRLVTFLTVTPAPGGGGDTTQFRLSGSISYNHVAQGAAVSVQSGGLQPLWIWS